MIGAERIDHRSGLLATRRIDAQMADAEGMDFGTTTAAEASASDQRRAECAQLERECAGRTVRERESVRSARGRR